MFFEGGPLGSGTVLYRMTLLIKDLQAQIKSGQVVAIVRPDTKTKGNVATISEGKARCPLSFGDQCGLENAPPGRLLPRGFRSPSFGGQVKCRSLVSLSISSLKTFAHLRTRRFAPAMPTPTSFSFTFPAYLTCPSSLAPSLFFSAPVVLATPSR